MDFVRMPPKKKYGGRRKKRGSRAVSFWDSKYSVRDVAEAAYKGVKYIKGLVNSEMYKLDISGATSTFYSDGSAVTHMTPVAQGDGVAARTGNSILAKYLTIHGVATRTTSGDAVQTCRLVIVMDKQNIADETNPGYSTVFTAANPHALINADTAGRFQILYDKVFTLDTVRSLARTFKINIPLNTHVKFNGTAATDIQKNSIWLMTISTQTVSNQPVFTYQARLGYHDN